MFISTYASCAADASGALWIASSAASLMAFEVRVAPDTVDHPLIVSSVASFPVSNVLIPFFLL